MTESEETRRAVKGCGNPTTVDGTNGGTMPCGAMLSGLGQPTGGVVYLCAECQGGGEIDQDLAEHFDAWLTTFVHESEQHEVAQAIHALLREHPDLPGSRSWPEMRRMAGA